MKNRRPPSHVPIYPKRKVSFSGDIFDGLADDIKSGRIPLERVTVSDDMQMGLRAIIRNTGLISFHVQYPNTDGTRPYLKLGEHPAMSVKEARELAKTVIALAARGIDVQAGLHERLVRELKEKGERWRP